MITYLKNMEGWKHNDLKSKDFDSIKELFDKAFKRVNMFVDYRTDLVEGSLKRAGEELEQESTKKQKMDEDKETVELKYLLNVVSITAALIDVNAAHSKNMVAYLKKPEGSEGFHQIVDFLNASHIRTLDNGEIELTAIIDGTVKTVTEASVRRHLQLADADGISSLPTTEIFEQLSLIGYVSTSDKLTF
ncbi:hypothetical protein Tco_0264907 [Tanacetum coccineum]